MKNAFFFAVAIAALVLAPNSQAQHGDAHNQGPSCMHMPDASYASTTQQGPDFSLVDIKQGDRFRARIYIGNYPSIERKKYAAAQRAHGAFISLTSENPPHQFLASSITSADLYLHVMFADDASPQEQTQLLDGMSSCLQ